MYNIDIIRQTEKYLVTVYSYDFDWSIVRQVSDSMTTLT